MSKKALKTIYRKEVKDMGTYERVLKILMITLERWIEDDDYPDEERKVYKQTLEYIKELIKIYDGEEYE